jgi:hypothetical protein
MFDQLPKMFGGKFAMRNDDNVTPLRDTEPTRPHKFHPQGSFTHSGTSARDWPSGSYGPPPRIQTPHDYEMEKAKAIFLAVVNEDAQTRERIKRQVDLLLELYSPDPPTVEGAPV